MTFVGSDRIPALPPRHAGISRMVIARGTTEGGDSYNLALVLAALVFVVALTGFILHKNQLGRSNIRHRRIGRKRAAHRHPNVRQTQFLRLCLRGRPGGAGGILHGSMNRMAETVQPCRAGNCR